MPVPVVLADRVPGWIGPLDVVVAHTADGNDAELADGVGLAVRRGAEVLLSAPAEGPVASAVLGLCPDLDLDAVRRELDDDKLVVWPVHLAGVRLRLPRETVDRHQLMAEQSGALGAGFLQSKTSSLQRQWPSRC